MAERVVNQFDVPYPDFKLDEIIDPEQFDSNNREIIRKVNEIIVVLNEDKTFLTGDHKGTWQGMTPGDASSESINGSRITALSNRVDVTERDIATINSSASTLGTRVSHAEGMLQDVQKEVANVALYQEASKRVVDGHTFGTNFESTFNMSINDVHTNLSVALGVGANLVSVNSSAGFIVGQDVYIFDDVNMEIVTIQSINGNSIVVTAVSHSYPIGSGFAVSMIDTKGYFRGSSKLEDTFTSLTGWSTLQASLKSDWGTDGGNNNVEIIASYVASETDHVDGYISKVFDLTNVSYITYDFRLQNTWGGLLPNLHSVGLSVNGEELIDAKRTVSTASTMSPYVGTVKFDVRDRVGVCTVRITNYGAGTVSSWLSVDNLRFHRQPTRAGFPIQLGVTDDVATWIEAKNGISFTAKLGSVDMTKTIQGVQTQFHKTQIMGNAVVNVIATVTGTIIKKIDKILGGFA